MGKFLMRRTAGGVKFVLKVGNSEIATISEPYFSEPECIIGIRSVMKNCTAAYIEDQTKETYAAEKNPKFEIYFDEAREFCFNLKDEAGREIAVSGGYKTKASCMNGIACLKKNAPIATIIEVGGL